MRDVQRVASHKIWCLLDSYWHQDSCNTCTWDSACVFETVQTVRLVLATGSYRYRFFLDSTRFVSSCDAWLAIRAFQLVANYFGTRRRYEPVEGKSINWGGDRTSPPPDVPRCGFDGKGCMVEGNDKFFLTINVLQWTDVCLQCLWQVDYKLDANRRK